MAKKKTKNRSALSRELSEVVLGTAKVPVPALELYFTQVIDSLRVIAKNVENDRCSQTAKKRIDKKRKMFTTAIYGIIGIVTDSMTHDPRGLLRILVREVYNAVSDDPQVTGIILFWAVTTDILRASKPFLRLVSTFGPEEMSFVMNAVDYMSNEIIDAATSSGIFAWNNVLVGYFRKKLAKSRSIAGRVLRTLRGGGWDPPVIAIPEEIRAIDLATKALDAARKDLVRKMTPSHIETAEKVIPISKMKKIARPVITSDDDTSMSFGTIIRAVT